MILTREGKEITAIYRQDGSEVEEVKDANGRLVYLASREIAGTLPISFSGRGKPLTDYLISGNTVQDGTPSPEDPVDVVGCGVLDETQQSYKLPLTVNSTEYPIYLGQVPTTRRIKKLVLTGEENWQSTAASGGRHRFTLEVNAINAHRTSPFSMCTHLPLGASGSTYSTDDVYTIASGLLYFRLTANYDSLSGFKSYLAAQYSAGTPVTVWYVLPESETSVVNEPLHKISYYKDTISFAQAGLTIPTVSGANVIDMASTIKPSEVYIKGKGIKPTAIT